MQWLIVWLSVLALWSGWEAASFLCPATVGALWHQATLLLALVSPSIQALRPPVVFAYHYASIDQDYVSLGGT